MKKPLEKDIQRDVLQYLEALRIYVHHSPNGAVFAGDARSRAMQSNALKRSGTRPGWPDLTLIRRTMDGHAVGMMEIKREGGKLSPEQEAFRDQCEDWRMPYAVVRSVADAQETLREWGWI